MPPSLTPLFSSLRYSPLLSLSPLRTLFSPPPPTAPTVQRYLLRQPFAGAPRECPTPVVLVRAISPSPASTATLRITSSDGGGEGQEHEESWADWGGMFAERGYTALEVDIAAPQTASDGGELSTLKAMSTLLASQIRLLAIPFAPIVIGSGAASCDLVQMYVEDNPASGLVLIDPATTASNPPTDGTKEGEGRGGGVAFTFEPNFPILLLGSSGRTSDLSQSRLGKAAEKGRGRGGKGVVLDELVDGPRGEKSRIVSLRDRSVGI